MPLLLAEFQNPVNVSPVINLDVEVIFVRASQELDISRCPNLTKWGVISFADGTKSLQQLTLCYFMQVRVIAMKQGRFLLDWLRSLGTA